MYSKFCSNIFIPILCHVNVWKPLITLTLNYLKFINEDPPLIYFFSFYFFRVTDKAVEPLKAQLSEVDQAIKDQLDLIAATKSNIARNDQKIDKLLQSVTRSWKFKCLYYLFRKLRYKLSKKRKKLILVASQTF